MADEHNPFDFDGNGKVDFMDMEFYHTMLSEEEKDREEHANSEDIYSPSEALAGFIIIVIVLMLLFL